MKNMFRLIVLLLLVGGWGLAASAIYVVRTPNSIGVIPKQRLTIGGVAHCYVDTRNWTLDDVAAHPELTTRLIESGKADLLEHIVPNSTGEALEAALHAAILRGPQPTQVQTTQPAGRTNTHVVTFNGPAVGNGSR